MDIIKKLLLRAIPISLLFVTIYIESSYAGNLEPTAPLGPTMKTLEQIEPRSHISPNNPNNVNETITLTKGSYYLTSNITCKVEKCITLSSNTSLDLNGFIVSCVPPAKYGIWVGKSATQHNFTVRNGSIINCHTGVHVTKSAFITFNNLYIHANNTGIHISFVNNATIDKVSIRSSKTGIEASSRTIVTNSMIDSIENAIYGAGHNIVMNNIIVSGEPGISSMTNSIIKNNVLDIISSSTSSIEIDGRLSPISCQEHPDRPICKNFNNVVDMNSINFRKRR